MLIKHPLWFTFTVCALIEVFSIFPTRSTDSQHRGPDYVQGGIHVAAHTMDESDPLGPFAKAARNANLDFVVLANLNEPLPQALTGTHSGVDFFAEMEVATPAGHVLVFHSHTKAAKMGPKELSELAWQHFQGTASVPGLFLAAAHPSSFFHPWERLDRIPEGIELINLRSLLENQALENPLALALTLATAPFNPYLASLRAFRPPQRDFLGWDAINSVSPGHFGLVATDNWADGAWSRRITARLPWRQALAAATNIVFPEGALNTDSFEKRRSQIYRALRDGRSALLFQGVHPYQGNDWALVCGTKQYRSGDKFALREPGCVFEVHLPATLPGKARLRLVRDGETVKEIENATTLERIPVEQDGAYRLEVWVHQHTAFRLLLNRDVPFLFYNPLYVR